MSELTPRPPSFFLSDRPPLLQRPLIHHLVASPFSFVIPPERGDVVVLILKHPGHNYLPSLFPASDRERFLCFKDPTPHGEGKLSTEEMSMMPKSALSTFATSPSENGTATPNAMAVNEWQRRGSADPRYVQKSSDDRYTLLVTYMLI